MPSRRTWAILLTFVAIFGLLYFYRNAIVPSTAQDYFRPASAPLLDDPPPHHSIIEVSNCTELRNALLNVQNHTTIFLDDGIYRVDDIPEQQFLTPYGRHVEDIHIRGVNGNRDTVIIEGPGQFIESGQYGFQIFDAVDVLIADLTIRRVYYHCISIHPEEGANNISLYNVRMIDAGEQLLKCNRDSGSILTGLSIQYCSFELTSGWGIHPELGSSYGNGMSLHGVVNATILDCFFFNLYYTDGNLADPAILVWNDSEGTIVERCVFINCARGIAFGLDAEQHSGGIVANNFFYRDQLSAPVDTAIYIASSDTLVCHNTIVIRDSYYAPIEVRFASSTNVVVVNNILDGGEIVLRDGAFATIESNTNLATSVWFVDMSHGNLHLVDNNETNTHAIDQSDFVTDINHDFDGDFRPQGLSLDLGADEITN